MKSAVTAVPAARVRTATLQLFSIWHLNLMYSAIEEEARADVVERCYWPLLRLAARRRLPVGIEASALTLEAIEAIDPSWIRELRRLARDGVCELVGSGYAQLIGPLVPARVNAWNLRLGNEAYERLVGVRPLLALVNEQAYSAGMVEHYLSAGYRGLVMEWDNPSLGHPDWPAEWRYLPQLARGAGGETIPVLWNNSIAFQKFQRYAHGDLERDELVDWLGAQSALTPRTLALYGNDAEIFDYRPKRYAAEPVQPSSSEWDRLDGLVAVLGGDPRFSSVLPSEALTLVGGDNVLELESAAQPVPVKKQDKYNVTRWAVTGRDDLRANTACYRIARSLAESPLTSDDDRRELCTLWSSDFRTHITERRWASFRARLATLEARAGRPRPAAPRRAPARELVTVTRGGRHLTIEGRRVAVALNLRRGLAFESVRFPELGGDVVAGTLPHGYYDDIRLGADFYTGHLVFEAPGQAKVTDLVAVEPEILREDAAVEVRATIATPYGPIEKRIRVELDEPRIAIEHRLDWRSLPVGSLRLGYLTLAPEAFDRDSLFYAAANGGSAHERFELGAQGVDHGSHVSFLVSASQALGLTDGIVSLGDARRALRVEVDKESAALVGLITYRELAGTYFYRLALSARETDETCRETDTPPPVLRYSITPGSVG